MVEDMTAMTGAEALLRALKRQGIDYFLANAGTDFPPIIEALSRLGPDQAPQPVTVPHETAAVAMAHGYYLVSGKPLAVMVHVNVGLANAVMGVINAASDNIPLLVLSGRTPISEYGRPGSRVTPIQYGQEMYNQSSLVADSVKFHYEMRYPEQAAQLVGRALSIAMSEPRGPVYLSLPREPLMETIPHADPRYEEAAPPAAVAFPDPSAIERAAQWIAAADNPVILCQRGDVEGRLGAVLPEYCRRRAIPVVEPFTIRNVMASADPMFAGHDPARALKDADLVLVLDSGVPWIRALHDVAPSARVIHVGTDPDFHRMPVRGYRSDLSITADPAAAITLLGNTPLGDSKKIEERRRTIERAASERRAATRALADAGSGTPMTDEWMSHWISDALDEDAVVFSELGVFAGVMDLKGPNRLFTNPHSGGLGWAMPAALGARLASPERLCVAVIGDGSYIFANPVACHQVSEALCLPFLTIIKNNGMWNAVRRSVKNGYPQGSAVRENTVPLTSLEPAPDYCQIAAASRAHVERVERGEDLPAALARALAVIRDERRQALIDVRVAVSDKR